MQSFDIRQLPDLGNAIGAQVQNAYRRGVYSAATRLLSHIKSTVIPNTPAEVPGAHLPVDRGLYRMAWAVTHTALSSDVYNPLPYAPIIEWGARAENIKIGRRMIDEIAAWAQRKGIVQVEPGEDPAAAARSAAWAIAQSMKKRGIFGGGRGLRVMERALGKVQQFVQEEVSRELGR